MIFEKDNLPMQAINICTNIYYQKSTDEIITSRLKNKKVMKDLNIYIGIEMPQIQNV